MQDINLYFQNIFEDSRNQNKNAIKIYLGYKKL